MAIIQTIPLGKKYGSMTSSEAQAGTNTESQLISAKVLNDQIDEKISDIGLATVATSGSYNDLNDKPAISTVNNGTLTIQKNGTTVKTFTANSSSNVTADITVPTKVSELTNDSGYITGVSWDNVSGKPSTFTPKAHTHAKSDITNFPTLATVATSGSYTDLSNKPTIPVIDSTLSATSTNGLQNKVIKTALDGKANSSHNHTKSQITDFPTLATVATSGSYNDLTNKPTIPTVNNATLTIQKNGTTVKTFSANASANTTANITVPTKVSDLTNDSGFINNTDNCVHLTGNESIANTKYFDSTNNSISFVKRITDYAREDTPTTNVYQHLAFQDKNNKNIALVQYLSRPSNVRDLDLYIFDTTGSIYGIQINTDKEVIPFGHNTYSLGTSNSRWNSCYATTFYGNLSGNAASATKATQDASGNVITTTYATKAENSLKANNSAVVHLTGDETISGTKYFTKDIYNKNENIVVAKTPTTNQYIRYRFTDNNNDMLASIQYASRTKGIRDLSFYLNTVDDVIGVVLDTNKSFRPLSNNSYSLGSSSAWWNSCYVTNVNTSYITTNSHTPLRMIYGSYGAFWRHDGTNLYLMLTNKDDQYGTYNSYRPITVNLSTGVCYINGYAAAATKATQDANGNVITNTYVTKTALSSGTNNGSTSTGVGSLILGCVSRNDMASAESSAHSNSFLNISGSVIKLASLSMVSSVDVFMINRDSTTLPGTWRFLGYSKQPSISLHTLGLFIRIA